MFVGKLKNSLYRISDYIFLEDTINIDIQRLSEAIILKRDCVFCNVIQLPSNFSLLLKSYLIPLKYSVVPRDAYLNCDPVLLLKLAHVGAAWECNPPIICKCKACQTNRKREVKNEREKREIVNEKVHNYYSIPRVHEHIFRKSHFHSGS